MTGRIVRISFKYRTPVERVAEGKTTATIRPYPRKLYEHVRVYPGGHIAEVVDVLPYSDELARQLVSISGFQSVEEWKEAYRKLVGRLPGPEDYIIVLKPGW